MTTARQQVEFLILAIDSRYIYGVFPLVQNAISKLSSCQSCFKNLFLFVFYSSQLTAKRQEPKQILSRTGLDHFRCVFSKSIKIMKIMLKTIKLEIGFGSSWVRTCVFIHYFLSCGHSLIAHLFMHAYRVQKMVETWKSIAAVVQLLP